MIDAPAVERLQLAGHFNRETIFELVDQLTTGVSEEKSAYIRSCISCGEPIPYKSIYPLFGIFSTVTRIFLPGWAVGFLNSTPLVLRSRIEAGFPVNRVEMGVGSLKTKGKWPDSVEVVEGPVPSYVSGRHDDYDDYPRNDDSDRGRYDRDGCIYIDSR
ncbi:hypothetical protein BDV93DRAFT_522881 [Ceratobasidium sp. AG-I]|nr:hypothetical protein BDV93DRAFT_522881 [Ceratobasidium sp. AG-I]